MEKNCKNCLFGMDGIEMQNHCNEAEWVDGDCDAWKPSLEDKITKLQNRLEEAEKALFFYTDHRHVNYNTKTAREYFNKHEKGEEG